MKPGQPVPTGTLRVTFDYFTHGAGDYFSVDSYSSLDYKSIPTFVSKDSGTSFDLRDCFDFRPRVDDSGTFAGATASITELPHIGTNLSADFSFYLARSDLIYMDRLGFFKVISGVPLLTHYHHNPQTVVWLCLKLRCLHMLLILMKFKPRNLTIADTLCVTLVN